VVRVPLQANGRTNHRRLPIRVVGMHLRRE
jgi:hypothetical protein